MQQVFEQVAVAIELPDWLMYKTADLTYAALGPAVDLFDGLVRTAAPSLVAYAETFTKERIHPASQKLPLMNPTYVVFGIVAYLVALVLLYPISKALGKLQLSLYAKLHNLFLFSLSFYMWAGILITAVANGFTLWNNPIGTGDGSWRMSKLLWLFYVSKLPEFNDTFIMMLKQNYRQVSFLHLYHHSTIFVIWFLVVMEGPGGDAYFSGMLNSGIHVIMYGYYFGTSVFATGPIRRFLNSIKFFITYGQMTQFSLNCVQSAYLLYFVPKPQYPVHLIKLLLVYMFTLLALFGNFLIQNQGKSAEGGKADKKKKTA